MNKLARTSIASLAALSFVAVACSDDDGDDAPAEQPDDSDDGGGALDGEDSDDGGGALDGDDGEGAEDGDG